jgi:hypothetical protein
LERDPLIVFASTYVQFWEDLEDPLKVTFDGEHSKIYLNPQYPTIRVKQDMYSAMKRWLQRRQNLSFYPPIRGIGGDPVGGGQYAGDLYFLTNDWQVVVQHQVAITGVLYNDNVAISTYSVQSGGGVTASVSSLAYAYNTSGVTVPTAAEVATQVWNTNPASLPNNTVGGMVYDTNNNVSNIKVTTDNILALSA